MIDLQKRKRVMQRSMRLGHCICNPKQPCPCTVFRERDICLCAGERLEPSGAEAPGIRLTRLVDSPGCASKIDQAALKSLLGGLPSLNDPRVLVGMAAGDDAGVFLVDERLALVQTVDVFTPSVDDPYVFGQVAAANSLSDVYAMGGRPLTALSIVGFPIRTLPDKVLQDILRGGIDKMAEAGVPVIGGHSIKDDQIKAGFAVTGVVDPARMMTNAAAQPGDLLVLTKPLGTGIIAFAAQIDRAPAEAVEAAAESMVALNKTASEHMLALRAHACTDVTGFGLMGHLGEMAAASGVDVEVVWDEVPVFPGTLECAAQGIASGAVERNRESSGERVVAAEGIEPAMLDVLFDPQTSGGLLVSLAPGDAEMLVKRLHEAGIPAAAVIGNVKGQGPGRVFVQTRGTRPMAPLVATSGSAATAGRTASLEEASGEEVTEECCVGSKADEESCCAEGHGGPVAAGTAGATELQLKFQELLKSANAPGALDARAKRAIAIALSVLSKCEPCLKMHIGKAQEMGMSEEEIDEAAWMGIVFGGSPVMMFYNAVRRR
jgi:selenide,water dikinase